ncbi:hypothetical protein Pelo_7606 [Pelomyxa schiedti]|nr:hypothetical protein Pelo_7606 [Pelomyxa schiedti]
MSAISNSLVGTWEGEGAETTKKGAPFGSSTGTFSIWKSGRFEAMHDYKAAKCWCEGEISPGGGAQWSMQWAGKTYYYNGTFTANPPGVSGKWGINEDCSGPTHSSGSFHFTLCKTSKQPRELERVQISPESPTNISGYSSAPPSEPDGEPVLQWTSTGTEESGGGESFPGTESTFSLYEDGSVRGKHVYDTGEEIYSVGSLVSDAHAPFLKWEFFWEDSHYYYKAPLPDEHIFPDGVDTIAIGGNWGTDPDCSAGDDDEGDNSGTFTYTLTRLS